MWKKPLSGGFSFEPCHPDPAAELYTHQQTPGTILNICRELYGHLPVAWRLLIQGHEWGFDTGLSDQAQKNLARAVDFFGEWMMKQ